MSRFKHVIVNDVRTLFAECSQQGDAETFTMTAHHVLARHRSECLLSVRLTASLRSTSPPRVAHRMCLRPQRVNAQCRMSSPKGEDNRKARFKRLAKNVVETWSKRGWSGRLRILITPQLSRDYSCPLSEGNTPKADRKKPPKKSAC